MAYFSRYMETPLTSRASSGKIRMLFGARQTGKTTLLKHLASKNALFVDLQDPSERLRYERQPGLLSRELRLIEKRCTVVIDEIQKVPSMLEDVQHIYDQRPGNFKFFITGSSARQLRKASANLLPGRSHVFHLSPVLLAETAAERSAILSLPTRAPRFQQRMLENILTYGSLPGILGEFPAKAKLTLNGYATLYVEEEIRREALVRNVGAFSQFLELAALEAGRVVNLTKLSRESGIPVNTLKSYYQVLRSTFLGQFIPAFGGSRKRVLTSPRFIFVDVGIRNALAGLPLSPALVKLQAGELFEQFVLSELWHRCAALGHGYRLSTWRTVTGAEVDAIVETPGKTIPIEIKWTSRPTHGDAAGLEKFLDIHPSVARQGYLICRCARAQRLTERVTALRWDRF